jgi:hypothetical protein
MIKLLGLVFALGILAVYPYTLSRHKGEWADYACRPLYSVMAIGATWRVGWAWPFLAQGPFVKIDIYEWGVRIGGPESR